MFGIFRDRKTKNARQLFEMACKVYNYRKDVIAEQDAKDLAEMIKQLDELILDGKVGAKEYEELAQKLEVLMKKCGGRIYPTSSWTDNVDTIIVVGIVALGIRSFFLQPFKIPTNSMYPSFYGMTAEAYAPGEDAPGIGERIARFALKGANNYSLEAPADGDLLLEINAPQAARFRGGFINFEEKNVRKYFGIWPTRERQYIFEVGGKKLELNLPADFSLDTVIAKALPIGDAKNIIEYLNAAHDKKMITSKDGKIYINYGSVKRGDRVINFDILSGDMLFVDRFTYNFKKPKVGDSIVFLTKYCDGMTAMNNGVPDDKYYIKRLVGVGGDELKVEGDTLMRNGKPITGSPAFAKNAKKEGLYGGYLADGALSGGKTVKVEDGHYYAMGDNSYNSLDSRYWGQVPARALVGKSLIIFYPFTSRWGATK